MHMWRHNRHILRHNGVPCRIKHRGFPCRGWLQHRGSTCQSPLLGNDDIHHLNEEEAMIVWKDAVQTPKPTMTLLLPLCHFRTLPRRAHWPLGLPNQKPRLSLLRQHSPAQRSQMPEPALQNNKENILVAINMYILRHNMHILRHNMHIMPPHMHITPKNMHIMPQQMHIMPQNVHIITQNMHILPQTIHIITQFFISHPAPPP